MLTKFKQIQHNQQTEKIKKKHIQISVAFSQLTTEGTKKATASKGDQSSSTDQCVSILCEASFKTDI